jgi:hypothetical protein
MGGPGQDPQKGTPKKGSKRVFWVFWGVHFDPYFHFGRFYPRSDGALARAPKKGVLKGPKKGQKGLFWAVLGCFGPFGPFLSTFEVFSAVVQEYAYNPSPTLCNKC